MIARIALVGDRSPDVRAHVRLPAIVEALPEVAAEWVPTLDALNTDFTEFDGVWMLPGSPYRSEAGAIAAARAARTGAIPLLATCGGFQHALLEFARNVCAIDAEHAENTPEAADPLIAPLACSLTGVQGEVRIVRGSRLHQIMGQDVVDVSYFCSYGPDSARLAALEAHGLRFTAHDAEGAVRAAELPGHPFYVMSLFQPELHTPSPHPLIRAFADAAMTCALPKR